MAVVYSVSASINRATEFGKTLFRQIGMNSGSATKEFAQTIDLRVTPLPLFPILIVTSDITSVKFLYIQVTGGTATIRLTKNASIYNNIDLDVAGTLLLSGVSLSQITILGTPTESCYIEICGSGT